MSAQTRSRLHQERNCVFLFPSLAPVTGQKRPGVFLHAAVRPLHRTPGGDSKLDHVPPFLLATHSTICTSSLTSTWASFFTFWCSVVVPALYLPLETIGQPHETLQEDANNRQDAVASFRYHCSITSWSVRSFLVCHSSCTVRMVSSATTVPKRLCNRTSK